MTAEEIIREIAKRSWRVDMHTRGCHTHGRDITPKMSPFSLDEPEPQYSYGPCDCGWAKLAEEINKYMDDEAVEKFESLIERSG